jgi:HEAT repeat protein
VVQALRDSLARDPSYVCASAALRALGSAAKSDAREAAIGALDRDSHEDVIRSAAVDVLAMDLALPEEERASDVKRLAELATAGKTDNIRSAALEALGKIGAGKDAALDAATKALDDERIRVRLNAIEALARLGDRRAIPSLEARKARELQAVFHDPVGAITRAIARIEGRTDVKTLQEDVRRLRAVNEDLERRLSELEKRGRTASF